MGYYKDYSSLQQRRKVRLPRAPIIHMDCVMGFFDGATQVGRCGCGILIKFFVHHYVTGWFGGGVSSNIRAELLACWGLLLLETYKHITNLHICGDSRAVID